MSMDEREDGEQRFTLGQHRHESSQGNSRIATTLQFNSKMKEILGHYKLRPRRAVTFIMQDSKPVYSLRPRSNSDSYFRNTWNYSQTSDLEPEHENDEQLLQAAATPRSAEEKEPPIHIPEEIKEKIESYDQTSDEKEDVLYEYKNGTDVLVAATKERLVRIITSASNLIDNDFLESFLVSYRNWFSPEELLDLISDRPRTSSHNKRDNRIGTSKMFCANSDRQHTSQMDYYCPLRL